MLSVQDAKALSIPLGLFASKDESREEVRDLWSHKGRCISFAFAPQFDKIVNVLSEKPFADKVDSKYYSNMFVIYLTIAPETYPFSTRHHGWAAARGDLSDPDNKREYEDLYSRAAAFFKNTLA